MANQLVVITGAASGIGRLLALRFADLGAKLALLDLMSEANEETKRMILQKRPHATVRTYKCDLNDRENVYRYSMCLMAVPAGWSVMTTCVSV